VGEPCTALPGGPIDTGGDGCIGRCWAEGEYLLWWTEGLRLPPLVTTSITGTTSNLAGQFGPSSNVLFGGDKPVNSDFRNGFRVRGGSWLNEAGTFGLEASFFLLESTATGFALSSGGDPILARPFNDSSTNFPSARLLAFPGERAGSVFAKALSDKLLGCQALMRQRLCCCDGFRLDLLAGYRFLHYSDRITVDDEWSIANPNNPEHVAPFTKLSTHDSFRTINNFNGADFGLATQFKRGPWVLDLRGSVAVGYTRQNIDIEGTNTSTAPITTQTGGLLAQSSNIGRHQRSNGALLPELTVNLGYQITEHWRVSVGYNLLWWENMVRAGDQIDFNVNPNLFNGGSAGTTGPLLPTVPFQRTSMLVQGLNFGVEVKY
jgi:hypothetical protein